MADVASLQIPFVGQLLKTLRRIRRWSDRAHWGHRVLGRQLDPIQGSDEGLVLIQIDGLPRRQLEIAIRDGRMPFLRQLLSREAYTLHSHYSGIPSTTAAVQAELFYGVRTAVPAHAFGKRETNEIVTMLQAEEAAVVEQSAKRTGAIGLLEQGSAYSNIYTGGAAHAHFCASAMGWGDLLKGVHPIRIAAFAVLHVESLIRIAGQALVELWLAVTDCLRGLGDWKELRESVKFLPSRIGVAVILRELITIWASMDAVAGLPVIQLNYLGYDEHAHRRGPDSRFAHWTLRGIDRCLRQIWRAASASERRHYQIWVYSDHGQERVKPFDVVTGRLVTDVVKEAFEPHLGGRSVGVSGAMEGIAQARARLLRSARLEKKQLQRPSVSTEDVLVAAIGPLGHIYLPSLPVNDHLMRACQYLAREGQIPLVLLRGEPGEAHAWTADGRYLLPRDAKDILGDAHPFRDVAADDLVRVCHHADAGDVVIGGWRAGVEPLSFVFEKGAHGGIGPEETGGFALLPKELPIHAADSGIFRPVDLREAALRVLHRAERLPVSRRRIKEDVVRVMTYNVHSCMGLDGRLSVPRIARVLSQWDADVIALQELDVQHSRSGRRDQALELAELLGMSAHFHPAISIADEHYGDAVLSRLPMRLVRAATLPGDPLGRSCEPRGAIWVAVEVDDWELQLVNTHLGLRQRERLRQVEDLLGPNWLSHPNCRKPMMLCGDFNAGPLSGEYRRITSRLQDAQRFRNGLRPRCTWCSPYPLLRIDHIFVSQGLSVIAVDVPSNALTRVASDHLPVVVDVKRA